MFSPRGEMSREETLRAAAMKIAQIVPPWLPFPPITYGGTEMVLFDLVEQQVAQGHDVTLFAPGDAKTSAKLVSFIPHALLTEGVSWSMHLKAFYHLQKALEEVEKRDFAIVHTHLSSSADMYLFPLTAPLAMPHITTLHSTFPFDQRLDGWVGDADSYYMDWAPCVPIVAISESARAQVPPPLNIVGVVHNGIAITQCPPVCEKREAYFVWLGRFAREKGAHLAIQAAKRANVPLILAGTIDPHRSDARHYFQEMIEPALDHRQITYIGPVNRQQKSALLRQARGFLNPIEWEEPFGMVMLEAMLAACPVISFDRGAARELILHGTTGFLVQTLDEMVQYIPQIDAIDRAATRSHVERHFSAECMAKRYTCMYENLIATPTGASGRSNEARARCGRGSGGS